MKPPRRVTLTPTRKGYKFRRVRRWPFDTMAVDDVWSRILSPRDAQSCRNSAYQYGQRHGKKFRVVRVKLPGKRGVAVGVERFA